MATCRANIKVGQTALLLAGSKLGREPVPCTVDILEGIDPGFAYNVNLAAADRPVRLSGSRIEIGCLDSKCNRIFSGNRSLSWGTPDVCRSTMFLRSRDRRWSVVLRCKLEGLGLLKECANALAME